MRRSRGFTLVEAIISLSLFLILGVTLLTLYLNGSRQYQEESKRSELAISATTFGDAFDADIQAAFAIEPTYGSYTSGASTIVLDLPAVDSSGTILLSGSSFVTDRAIYTRSGSQVLKSIVPGSGSNRPTVTNRAVASHVTAFSITYPSGVSASGGVSWNLTEAASYQSRHITLSLSRTTKLRNKT